MAFAHGLQVSASGPPCWQMEWAQSHCVWQVVLALSTQACVQPVEQHAGMAAHTATTHGSEPQSCAARMLHEASHDALPQQPGFCAHT